MNKCYFCVQNKIIDYKDPEIFKRFISGQMKIYPAKKTKLCTKHQRQLQKAVKRARIIGLLPFARE
ncbi:MAG: 30S ribosomal protein S18 [Candidatus Paceibacterota bacterium]|jgi:small subunit ribosomal protein S18|nr:30S ribosomal protein S18 [Candidatus Paceibacterota bacterium]MDD3548354.1 30S ribosomal protein S18 [Candidatus Paceibacterota bacterium]MDD4998886.1 30S ribosomal protein S18 [Candidatus Paceibacterota bacterium]MDD5545119.1 30S ribosomal protein S18 [Candidatus Paceibacterota bacterium]